MSLSQTRGGLIARNSILNFGGQFIPLIVGIVSIPFVINGMGVDAFGILSLASMLLGYFTLFDLGLGRATTKFIAEELNKGISERLRKLFWSSCLMNLAFGIVGGVLVAILASPLAESIFRIPPDLIDAARTTFFILSVSTPVILVSAVFRGTLEAAQRFEYVNSVVVISSSLTFLLPVLGLLMGFGVKGIVVLLMIAKLASTFAYFWLCIKVLPILKGGISFDFAGVRRLLVYGGWIGISNVVHPMLVYLDRLLIGSLISVAAVAYYVAPYEMITKMWILPVSLTMTLFPAFSAIGTTSKEELTHLYARSVKYLVLLVGPLVLLLILFAEEVLRLWLGAEFATHSTLVIRILAVGVFFDSLAHIPHALLQGIGRPDITAKFHMIELPLYVPLMWLLVSGAGITGAAVGCTLRVTLNGFFLFWASGKFLNLGAFLKSDFRRGMSSIAIMASVLFAVSLLGASVLVKTIVATGTSILFFCASWRFVLDESERKLVSTAIHRFTGMTIEVR